LGLVNNTLHWALSCSGTTLTFIFSIQLNVGIIAASIPAMKPLLKKTTGTSKGHNHNQYDDIENPKTFGSGGPSRPRRSIMSTLNGTRTDEEDFEMTTRLSSSGQDQKNVIYTVSEERAGSEDLILDEKNLNRIRCTAEVVVDSVGTAR
jgi:outer membrane cobalamin receptor